MTDPPVKVKGHAGDLEVMVKLISSGSLTLFLFTVSDLITVSVFLVFSALAASAGPCARSVPESWGVRPEPVSMIHEWLCWFQISISAALWEKVWQLARFRSADTEEDRGGWEQHDRHKLSWNNLWDYRHLHQTHGWSAGSLILGTLENRN